MKEEELTKDLFKYDLVNAFINYLLESARGDYKDIPRDFLIDEFYLALNEIIDNQESITKSLNNILDNEL